MLHTATVERIGSALETLEARIKEAHALPALQDIQAYAQSLEGRLPKGISFLRARWLFLDGVLHMKIGQHDTEAVLQDSLALFHKCFVMTKELGDLKLQRLCVYEALVAESVLFSWGKAPSVMFGSDHLLTPQRRDVADALKTGGVLRSRF